MTKTDGGEGNVMLQRILTGIVGIFILLGATYLGGAVFLSAILLIVFLGLLEFAGLLERKEVKLEIWLLVLAGLSFPVLAYFNIREFGAAVVFTTLAVGLLVAPFREDQTPLFATAAVVFGSVYIGWSMSLMVALEMVASKYVFLSFLIVWANDTAAYFVGARLGRHKLWPKVSPKKSVEGAMGGLLATMAVLVAARGWLGVNVGNALLLGALFSVTAQLGDFAESIMKRDARVKDAGSILPGHGGILDRFDSLFFVLPLMYFLHIALAG